MLKYKHIEAAREVRLWIAQIIVPVAGIAMMVPEARKAVVDKFQNVKARIKRNRIK